jgi:hypothetical protein
MWFAIGATANQRVVRLTNAERKQFLRLLSLQSPEFFNRVSGEGDRVTAEDENIVAASLHVSRDEVAVSVSNLYKLGHIIDLNTQTKLISPFGREFSRAVSG